MKRTIGTYVVLVVLGFVACSEKINSPAGVVFDSGECGGCWLSWGSGLFSMAESGGIAGYLCATTVTTIHYLATKVLGAKRSREEIEKLLSIIDIAPVNRTVLEGAMRSRFSDYEDVLIHEAALQVNATAIVTRNVQYFKRSSIAVYSPTEFVRMLRATEGNS